MAMDYRNIFRRSPGIACVFDRCTRKICDVNANFERSMKYAPPCDLKIDDLMSTSASRDQVVGIINSFNDFQEIGIVAVKTSEGALVRLRASLTDLVDNNLILLSGEITGEEDWSVPLARSDLIALLKDAPVGLQVVKEGVVQWANDTLLNILGYRPDEYIGHHVIKTLYDIKAVGEMAQRVKAGEVVQNFVHRIVAKDGSLKLFLADVDQFRLSDGCICNRGFLRINVDHIVNENQVREQLQRVSEASAEKDAFIRIMFHTLRTPLHNLSLAFNNFAGDAKMPGDASTDMKYQIDLYSEIVEDLSFATMFESDQVLHPRPVSLHLRRELEGILEHAGHELELSNKSIAIDRRVEAGVPESVAVDRSVLRVMGNLISNAVKYCGVDGVVTIHLSHQPATDAATNERISFSVSNTVNKAIDLVEVNRMFQSCFSRTRTGSSSAAVKGEPETPKGDSPRSAYLSQSLTSLDGLGLGVYVAYNIVQSLGGLLECSGDDKQARFSFTIPVGRTKSSPKVAVPALDITTSWLDVNHSVAGTQHVVVEAGTPRSVVLPVPEIVEPDSRKPHVLVVDDSPVCRKVLCKQLESNGYTVNVACDGQQACEILAHPPLAYHLVLMDLRMPIMDGITATRRCKELAHLRDLPIVIVTAETGEDVRREAMEAQATHFISKPVRINELLECTRSLIQCDTGSGGGVRSSARDFVPAEQRTTELESSTLQSL